MNKKTYLVLALWALIFCFISCDDDSDIPDNRALAVLGSWTLTSYEADQGVDPNGDGIFNTNLRALEMSFCEHDDWYVFLSEAPEFGITKRFARYDRPGSTDYPEGVTCNPEGEFEVIFRYNMEFSEDQEEIYMDYDQDGTADAIWEIVSFSGNRIELLYQEDTELQDGSTAQVNYTMVLTKLA